jgi:hypothetical protein
VEDGPSERQLNIHIDPEVMGGVYANFATSRESSSRA